MVTAICCAHGEQDIMLEGVACPTRRSKAENMLLSIMKISEVGIVDLQSITVAVRASTCICQGRSDRYHCNAAMAKTGNLRVRLGLADTCSPHSLQMKSRIHRSAPVWLVLRDLSKRTQEFAARNAKHSLCNAIAMQCKWTVTSAFWLLTRAFPP